MSFSCYPPDTPSSGVTDMNRSHPLVSQKIGCSCRWCWCSWRCLLVTTPVAVPSGIISCVVVVAGVADGHGVVIAVVCGLVGLWLAVLFW